MRNRQLGDAEQHRIFRNILGLIFIMLSWFKFFCLVAAGNTLTNPPQSSPAAPSTPIMTVALRASDDWPVWLHSLCYLHTSSYNVGQSDPLASIHLTSQCSNTRCSILQPFEYSRERNFDPTRSWKADPKATVAGFAETPGPARLAGRAGSELSPKPHSHPNHRTRYGDVLRTRY